MDDDEGYQDYVLELRERVCSDCGLAANWHE